MNSGVVVRDNVSLRSSSRHLDFSFGPWPLIVLAFQSACAGAPLPPVEIAESAAYQTLKKKVAGFLQVDVDDDGYPDGILMIRDTMGFVPTLYRQQPGDDRIRWVRECEGEPLKGEDLGLLRWIDQGERRLLLATASSEDPDQLTIDFGLYAPDDPCREVMREERRFDKPTGVVVAPEGLRLGLQTDDQGRLVVVHNPETLRLRGDDGEIELVTSVGIRRLDAVGWSEGRFELLQPVAFSPSFGQEAVATPDVVQGASASRVVTPSTAQSLDSDASNEAQATASIEVDDHDSDLLHVWNEGELGRVRLTMDRPAVLIEISHGCDDEENATLEIVSRSGPSLFVTGHVPPTNSVFRASASGRRRSEANALELLALTESERQLELFVGPIDDRRCLRRVSIYAWRDRD